jgi:hypothetical protein
MVPEDKITFAFALCDPCAEVMGPIAHTYQEPDAVFWEKLAHEMEQASVTTIAGLAKALETPSSPLSSLAKDWQAYVQKGS